MATLAQPAPATQPAEEFRPKHWTEKLPAEALDHIPGEGGWPIVGNTFRMLADPHGFARRMYETYGPVYKNRAFGGYQVALIGAEGLIPDSARHFTVEMEWWREGEEWKLARLSWQ